MVFLDKETALLPRSMSRNKAVLQSADMWLERWDKRKKDPSENDSDYTDGPDLHTGL